MHTLGQRLAKGDTMHECKYSAVSLREAIAEWRVPVEYLFDRDAGIQNYADEAAEIAEQFEFPVEGDGLELRTHPIVWYLIFR